MFFLRNLTRRRVKLIVRGASFVVLLIILLLTSCSEPDTKVNLNGNWKDDYGSGYNITASSLEYYTSDTVWGETTYPGENIKGSIRKTVDFSKNAGVIIVQIITSSTTGQAGKFFGVYYRDCTASHVFLANAIDTSYNLILKVTLAEAENTFNVDNVETHVTYWGSGYKR